MINPRKAIFAILCLCSLSAAAQDRLSAITRELPEYQCKITLPAGYELMPVPSGNPNVKMLGKNKLGVVLSLAVMPSPSESDQINAYFAQGFDQQISAQLAPYSGFDPTTATGRSSVTDSGALGTFRGVPCYTITGHINNGLEARMAFQDSVVTFKAFIANGQMYLLSDTRLTALADPDPHALENIFQGFEFIGTPKIPDPSKAKTSGFAPGIGAGTLAYATGRIVFYAILLAIALYVVSLIFRGAKKKIDSNETDVGSGE